MVNPKPLIAVHMPPKRAVNNFTLYERLSSPKTVIRKRVGFISQVVIATYVVAMTNVGIMNFLEESNSLTGEAAVSYLDSIPSIITCSAENGWAPTTMVPSITPSAVDLPIKNVGVPLAPTSPASAKSFSTSA